MNRSSRQSRRLIFGRQQRLTILCTNWYCMLTDQNMICYFRVWMYCHYRRYRTQLTLATIYFCRRIPWRFWAAASLTETEVSLLKAFLNPAYPSCSRWDSVLWPSSADGSEGDGCNKLRSAKWTLATLSYIEEGF